MPRIETEMKLNFNNVLIRPKRSKLKSRSEVDLERPFKFKYSDKIWFGVPIMAANMDTTGTFEMAQQFAKNKMIVCLHKHYSVDQWKQFISKNTDVLEYIAVSAGTSDSDIEKLEQICNLSDKIQFICLDVANGYSEHFVSTVKRVRQAHPNHIIMAGNVVTAEMTEQLILNGADIVKVGIGPGSVCTTRKQTGVGYPQLSAVIECADAAHGLGGHVISDGGCTCPGDFSKAFGAGADFVMAGGLFAGHTESGGELIEEDGKKYKCFYGMSSALAMKKYNGKVANYRSSEGKCVTIPFRGDVNVTILDLLGGIRSTCTYVGAAKIKELPKRTTFVRTMQQLNNVFS